MTPFRRRLRSKTDASVSSPVALLVRRLSTDGADRSPVKALDAKSVAAELASLVAEGEQQAKASKESTKPQKGSAPAGDDDDPLFDADDDELEGEEDIGLSDAGEDAELSEDEGDIADAAWQPIGALPWPDVWSAYNPPTPGDQGFNAYAAERLARAGLGKPSSPFAGLGLHLHQESAAFLIHPKSPMTRLLVDHATGSGKTLILIRMLDNYFDDPRPKVAIFPKDRVVESFYQELLKWPSRWREFFAFSRPDDASLASGAANWKRKRMDVWDLNNERVRMEAKSRGCRLETVVGKLVERVKEVLNMSRALRKGKITPSFAQQFKKDHPGAPVPRAPLRAFRYTTAGGNAAELCDDGWPNSPILRVGFDPKELNPYSGKMIIMDECHNLVRPTQRYEEQLGRLRDYLVGARNTVLAGFTGTPVGNDAQEGRMLLDVIKGVAKLRGNDEGFVSSFHARGGYDFPREEPVAGVPDGVLHEGMFESLVVKHSLHGEALKRYLLKDTEYQVVPRLVRLPEEKRIARVVGYCNLHVYIGAFAAQQRSLLLKDTKGYVPKMHAVARAIVKNKEKTVVMLTREMGFRVMLELLRKTAKKAGFRVATMTELSDFNDPRRNLRGERFRVLLAETSQAGEGVSFHHVRRVHLLDVPLRHSDLVQRVSRCVRLGGHKDLPPEERTITVQMHAAQLPKFLKQGPTSLIYRELLNAKDVMQTPGTCLEDATEKCNEELRERKIKTLFDFQKALQAEDGEKLIELLTEIALENLGQSSKAPARPMAMALWRLRRGGDDLSFLERALCSEGTADEKQLSLLVDKSAELLPPLEAMRFGAVDRPILAPLGDPPRAPPPRNEKVQQRAAKAVIDLEPDVQPGPPAPVEGMQGDDDDGLSVEGEDRELNDDELEAELMKDAPESDDEPEARAEELCDVSGAEDVE